MLVSRTFAAKLDFSTPSRFADLLQRRQFGLRFRLDIFVEQKVIVELKTVENLLPIHEAQLLTYLKMTNCKLGLLLNFNAPFLRNGIKRIANNL